jgi:hypothetical protein
MRTPMEMFREFVRDVFWNSPILIVGLLGYLCFATVVIGFGILMALWKKEQ